MRNFSQSHWVLVVSEWVIILVVILKNWLLWFVVSEKQRIDGRMQRAPSRLRSCWAVWVYLKRHPFSGELAQRSHKYIVFGVFFYICFLSPSSELGWQWATHSLLALRILLHSVFPDWCFTKLCQKIHHPNRPHWIWIWGKKNAEFCFPWTP